MDHTMVALKGKNGHEELISAQKAIDTLGVELIDEEKFMIEEDATRINLYFKKGKWTGEICFLYTLATIYKRSG